MASILALDTTAEACSVALLNGDQVLERVETQPRQHTRRALPLMRAVLAEAGLKVRDLDAVAFGCGPGSFTGLRIAAGLAQGLALGAALPVVPVSSLAAVAHRALQERTDAACAVAFDARMDEVYWGCYQWRDGELQLLGVERVCPPEAVELPGTNGPWIAAGGGWSFRSRMPSTVTGAMSDEHPDLVPLASDIARLAESAWRAGRGVPAEQAQPVYLRDEVAWKKLPGRD